MSSDGLPIGLCGDQGTHTQTCGNEARPVMLFFPVFGSICLNVQVSCHKLPGHFHGCVIAHTLSPAAVSGFSQSPP